MPDSFDKQQAAWRVAVAPGYSSPVLTRTAVILTAAAGEDLFTLALDRESGEVLWEAPAPDPVHEFKKGPNSLVSPTPATDGENTYVFFDIFGIVSYDGDGVERWRTELGPFSAPYGMGASPIFAEGKVLLQADHDQGSFLLALDSENGEELWRTERPGKTHGFSTPIVYRPEGGSAQLVASGSYETIGYDLEQGQPLWSLPGMAWQAKCTPIVVDQTLYVSSWMAGTSELGVQNAGVPWEEMLEANDEDENALLSKAEMAPHGYERLWFLFDLDGSGELDEEEWTYNMRRNEAKNGLYAVDLTDAAGDLSEKVSWTFKRSLPNIPSPLYYDGILYVLKEGGVLTALDPESGETLQAGRVDSATGSYYASPIAAGGKILTASQAGELAVIQAGAEWEVLSLTAFEEEIWATPAIGRDALFVRTEEPRVRGQAPEDRTGYLYCFPLGE